jgi:hypothetical protein
MNSYATMEMERGKAQEIAATNGASPSENAGVSQE